MTGALIRHTIRERLAGKIFVALLVVLSLSVLAGSAFSRSPDLSDPGLLFVLLLGSGLVGADVASGALTLTFTRPLPRWRYLLTRWLAAVLLAGGLSLGHLLVQFGVLVVRGKAPGLSVLAESGFESLASVVGASAVLLLCSTLVSGRKDIALFLGLILINSVLAQFAGLPPRLQDTLREVITPSLTAATTFGVGVSWLAIASFGSNVLLVLALAVWVINRKEVSYATT